MPLSRNIFLNLVLAMISTSGCLQSAMASVETVDRIVVIVNDEIITQSDTTKFVERLKTGGLTDDLLIPDDATRQAVMKDRDKLIQKMIDEKIIDSEVKKQNLSVPIERVEQQIREIAKRNDLTREQLRAALQERGVVFSQYQDFIKTGLERQSLVEKAITQKIKISEDDVTAAYAQKTGGAGDLAYEYTLSHIYFRNDKGGAAAARTAADDALTKLKGGANFEKLAAEVSQDPGFEEGGALGVFKPGELAKELEQVVQKLNSGEFSAVLPTTGGFHIVKVNKKRLIADPRTEKEREKVRGTLYENQYKKQFVSWLEQLRQDAFIRINAK